MPTRSLGLLAALLLPACNTRRVTAAECAEIFDRIVDLELKEMGYSDPVLAARKREQLAALLAPELVRCEGLRMPRAALACVRRAATAEEITHRCLK